MSNKGKTSITELWPREESKRLCALRHINKELHESMNGEEWTVILYRRISLTEHGGSRRDGKSPPEYFRTIVATGPPMDDDISG